MDMLSKARLKRVREVGPNQYVVGKCVEEVPSAEEVAVLAREGFRQVEAFQVYKSYLVGNTRYKSIPGQNPEIKSDVFFIYTHQDTFCTIRKVVPFRNGNDVDDEIIPQCGMFVTEHDVAHVLPVARHISVLGNDDADLLHYVPIDQVRCPAVKMYIEGVSYATCVPNCYEID